MIKAILLDIFSLLVLLPFMVLILAGVWVLERLGL